MATFSEVHSSFLELDGLEFYIRPSYRGFVNPSVANFLPLHTPNIILTSLIESGLVKQALR
jgi:hypothetical protein